MTTRRTFMLGSMLLAPLVRFTSTQGTVSGQSTSGAMRLCMHQNTSRGAGFRGSLEGWARAGVRYAEGFQRYGGAGWGNLTLHYLP